MMMNRNRSAWVMGGVIFFVSSCLAVPVMLAHQGTSEESSGPRQDTGGTIIAPKNSRAPQPVEPLETSEKPDVNKTFALSEATELVNFDVRVTDKNGNFIPTLQKPDFLFRKLPKRDSRGHSNLLLTALRFHMGGRILRQSSPRRWLSARRV